VWETLLTVKALASLENVNQVQGRKLAMKVDELPGWERLKYPFVNALNFAFGCHHKVLSRVFTIDGRTYKVCCECGAHLDYSLKEMALVHRRPSSRALRYLRARHI
jgi:hypothetical protein